MPGSLKEKGQYTVALSIIGVMLYVAGFPIFLLFFVGILTFFIWKVFSSEGRQESRRIFEFYLSANEILREDERRWYGFEIQETIVRGENISRSMSAAPPLVSFALGALYQKLDDHSSAVRHLERVVDEAAPNETAIVFPTRELREYVRMLRKIERAPAEAPMTSSAVRSLERARKNRGRKLLDHSRMELSKHAKSLPKEQQSLESIVDVSEFDDRSPIGSAPNGNADSSYAPVPAAFISPVKRRGEKHFDQGEQQTDRQTISEVLHDIYDKNIQ